MTSLTDLTNLVSTETILLVQVQKANQVLLQAKADLETALANAKATQADPTVIDALAVQLTQNNAALSHLSEASGLAEANRAAQDQVADPAPIADTPAPVKDPAADTTVTQ